jgi:O-antigen/teichoic acid export membrane protein
MKNKKKEDHKQRAYLNSVTSILDHLARQLIGFVVSPFIVKGLGNTLYGVYQVVLELAGYANMADTQSTQVLKWTLAKKRSVSNEEELKSEITTGLVIVLLILPIILVAGGIISWFAPTITNVPSEFEDVVRIASFVVIVAIIIDKVTGFFESILRGMNLGFKGMGVRTFLIVLSGLSKIAVIYFGFGLIGLTVLQVLIALLTCAIFYLLVKRNIPWFGFGKTDKNKVLSYTKLSGWFMATKISGMALFHSEKILLSFLVGPELVTIYVLTLFTSSTLKGLLDSVISGVVPGVGSFFGNGEFEKIKLSHQLINSLIWWLSFGVGVSIILFNEQFLQLWVGGEKYAGNIENFLIILIAVQYVFFFTTGNFINVTLDLKTKVYITGMSAIVSIAFTFLLVGYFGFGILGLCISILVGRLLMTIGLPMILSQKIGEKFNPFKSTNTRPLTVFLGGLGLALFLQPSIKASNWFELIGYGILVSIFSLILFWFLAFNKSQKHALRSNISKIKFLKIREK